MSPLIQASSLSKVYGAHHLFDDATFYVNALDRVALVGPNGAGKSTLLRLLAGRERADSGTLEIQPVRTHWFDQHPTIPPGATVADVLAADRPLPPRLAAEKAELEARISDPALYEAPGYEAVLERYAGLEREIRLAVAPPSKGSLFSDLGFSEKDLPQPAAKLSGGEKTRLFLARTLVDAKPGDLVVLDEPTNHLDVESIEWLEDWLSSFAGTVLVVAHDRVFLDNVATRVFEVSQGRIRSFQGNYEDYAAARDEDIERQRRDHQRAQERVEAAKGIILQYRKQKRFDGQYASKMKALEKYQAALAHAPDPVLEKLGFGLAFDAVAKSSREMIRAKGVAKAFEGTKVLAGADLEVEKGDRIGLVGGNGSGKTTLLKILTGRLPADSGTVHAVPGVKGIFVAQEHDDLDPKRTLHAEVLAARSSLSDMDVKALVGRFRFSPESDLRRTVATLSGGERQRLMLLKAVLKPSNLLVLDEPTNHLDLWAREVVIEALRAYHGSLLVVSHDRYLLDSVTEKTAVLEDGRIHLYPGSYTETRDLHGARVKAVKRTRRYVVRKRFTDWATDARYLVDQEVDLSEEELEASRSLQSALAHGWLEEKGR